MQQLAAKPQVEESIVLRECVADSWISSAPISLARS